MSRLSKKRFIILAIVLIVFITVGVLWIKHFRATHPTHYRFNDEFVIGSTADEIQDRYGDFDIYYEFDGPSTTGVSAVGIYQVSYKNNSWIFYRTDEFYNIHFDENGIAIDIYFQEGWPGG